MKRCSRCKVLKSESTFRQRKRSLDGLSSACKDCLSSYEAQWYKSNPSRRKKIRTSNKKSVQRNHAFVAEFLKTHSCVDCGETDILVLEFDHQHDKSFSFSVGSVLHNALGLDTLVREIDKCQVRCSNCHQIKTALEMKSWRLQYR